MIKEASKQLVFWVLIFCGASIVVIFVGWFKNLPNPVGMLAAIVSLAGAANAYYTWKARSENLVKIKQNGIFSKEEIALIMQMREQCSPEPTVTERKEDIGG